jgi:hypothetical protein
VLDDSSSGCACTAISVKGALIRQACHDPRAAPRAAYADPCVRQQRRSHRARGDAATVVARQRSGPPGSRGDFQDRRTLEIGGERIELAWHGANHSPDNSYIYFPEHDTLMLVDIVNAGWVPVYNLNLTEDRVGYVAAPDHALSYPWKHLISGHLGRLGTRDDVNLHQQYIADISENARTALATVDPTPYFQKYGTNAWAAVKGYLDEVANTAAAPVIEKYTGVLAAADVFTAHTTFWLMESIRLDLGVG